MRNRKILIMSFSGLVLAVALGILILRHLSGPACWDGDEKSLLYSVLMREKDGDGPGTELQGKLAFTRLDSPSFFAPKPLRLSGHFQPLQFQSQGNLYKEFRDFTYEFGVNFDKSCRIESLEFDGRESFSARRTLQRLVRVLALGKSGEYSDFLGKAQMKELSRLDDRIEFEREGVAEKDIKTSLSEDVKLSAVKKSLFEFEGPFAPIFANVSKANETLDLIVGSKQDKKLLSYSIEMRKIEGEVLPAKKAIAKEFSVHKKIGEDLKGHDRPSIYDFPSQKPAPSADLSSALVSFRAQLKSDDAAAKIALIEFLRQHPEAIKDLKDMIVTRDFSDEELIHILFSIAKTGSDEAQDAMANLIKGDGVDKATRLRTIFAVSEVKLPSDALVQALRDEYQALKTGGQAMDEIQSTALLNSGLLANNLREVRPGEEAKILDDLREVYSQTREDAVRANALDAMGNSGNEVFKDELSAALKSQSEIERKAAYEALARVPLEGREKNLITAAGSDQMVPARMAAWQSLRTVGIRDVGSVVPLQQALSRESDAGNRAAAVQVLGQATAAFPEARTALLQTIATEKDPGVLQAAGRYVSAYDILKAKGRP